MTDHKICLAFENMHDCCHRVRGFCTSKHPQTSLWTVFTHLLLHTGPHSQKLKDHVVPVLHLLLSFSSSCGSKGSTSVIAAQLSQFTRGGGVPLPAFIHQSLPFLHFASVPFYSSFIAFSVVSGKIFVLVNNKKVHYESDGNSEHLSGQKMWLRPIVYSQCCDHTLFDPHIHSENKTISMVRWLASWSHKGCCASSLSWSPSRGNPGFKTCGWGTWECSTAC